MVSFTILRHQVASVVVAVLLGGSLLGVSTPSQAHDAGRLQHVIVPEADRFAPFALEIHAGDTVEWSNHDTDDHTIVSDRAFTTAGHREVNQLLPGTVSNGGKAGTVRLRFTHPGTFVYYCRFHAHLDAFNQPVAPGPEGGIQDANGNDGTPMMGVITVLPSGKDGTD